MYKFCYLLSIVLCWLPRLVNAQFTDNFSDGDYTLNPTWSGDTAKFEVDVSNKLHLLAPAVTDIGYLSTPSQAIETATWEFYVEMGFNPSSSNKAYVYLTSDNANLTNSLNGYYVMIGNTLDEICLYRQDGLSSTKIIDGVDGTVNLSTAIARVKVTRDITGNWELFRDTIGGTTYYSEGTVFDNTYTSSAFTGIYCKYTSTRSTLFWYDDFIVTGNPYSGPTIDTAAYRGVVINEIMADETPQVGLPAAEYIELMNTTTADTFDLVGFTFTDGTSVATLSSYILVTNDYVLVCAAADTALFTAYTLKVMGVGSFPSLNNSGDNLVLKNQLGNTIDQVNYTTDWYNDATKSGGGWSIEQINPYVGCVQASNWHASIATPGGTPGSINSVFNNTPDITPPVITGIAVNSSTSITVTFSEMVDSSSVLFTNFNVAPINIILMATPNSPNYTSATVLFLTPLDTNVIYSLQMSNVSDCEGNTTPDTANFVLPYQARPGDVLINEVLFNPFTGGVDMVEIYNNSDRLLGLVNWTLANSENDTIANNKQISSSQLLFSSHTYRVCTTDSNNIRDYYPLYATGTFIQMASLPSYNNDSGTVYLIDNLNRLMDHFSYNESMHFALLNNFEGISLERLDFNRESNDVTNWHSASEAVGFATPGYKNSQYYPESTSPNPITIDPEVFSPDNDGYQDVLSIHYTLDAPGYVGNITIYDAHGRLMRYLMQNELLGIEGTISWDGITETSEKARIGAYVLLIEFFDLNGQVKTYKRTCVVGGKF